MRRGHHHHHKHKQTTHQLHHVVDGGVEGAAAAALREHACATKKRVTGCVCVATAASPDSYICQVEASTLTMSGPLLAT